LLQSLEILSCDRARHWEACSPILVLVLSLSITAYDPFVAADLPVWIVVGRNASLIRWVDNTSKNDQSNRPGKQNKVRIPSEDSPVSTYLPVSFRESDRCSEFEALLFGVC
jgi:hypothetical protein